MTPTSAIQSALAAIQAPPLLVRSFLRNVERWRSGNLGTIPASALEPIGPLPTTPPQSRLLFDCPRLLSAAIDCPRTLSRYYRNSRLSRFSRSLLTPVALLTTTDT